MIAAEKANQPPAVNDRYCSAAVFLKSGQYTAKHVERTGGFEIAIHDVGDTAVLAMPRKR